MYVNSEFVLNEINESELQLEKHDENNFQKEGAFG
jgi:hypothetical protein